jgi:hypothetical protein
LSRAFLPSDGVPELSVDLWDEDATGTRRPAGPVEDAYAAVTGPGERVDLFAGDRYARCGGPGFSIWCDREEGKAAGWVQAVGVLTEWSSWRPLQPLLGAWLRPHGVRLIHAGAVSQSGASVLLPGLNGSGKSTSSIAALCGGLSYLGDDAVAVEANADGGYATHALHGVGKFATALFPDLARRAGTPSRDSEGPPESYAYLH